MEPHFSGERWGFLVFRPGPALPYIKYVKKNIENYLRAIFQSEKYFFVL